MWTALILTVAAAATPSPIVATSTVQHLERLVSINSSRTLDQYDRYYAPTIISGRSMIVGVYLSTQITDQEENFHRGVADWSMRFPSRSGRVHVLERESDFPAGIADGGCMEIHVFWDVALAKVLKVKCNGR